MPCLGFHAISVLQTIQAACPSFQDKGLRDYVGKSALDFMMLWHCDSKYDHQIKERNTGHRFILQANSAWKDEIPVNRKYH